MMSDKGDISLKVMRIARPMFQQESSIYTEEGDIFDLGDNGSYSGLSDSLLIPNSVGDFYLGEPANFMVTVQNLSPTNTPLENVTVVIQTESRNVPRATVHNSMRTIPLCMSEFETIYFKIDCRYPEEIAMMCEVAYEREGQTDLNFKRKYLLPVKTPFDIHWGWTVLGEGKNLLKMTIKNKIEKQIIFEECNIKDQSINIETLYQSKNNVLLFDQYFTKTFGLETLSGDFSNIQLSLDLIWKNENGNRGHIQYSQIRPKMNTKDELDVRLIPEELPLKFQDNNDLLVVIRNNTERSVDLTLELDLDETPTIQWSCKSNRTIGILEPKSQKEIDLRVVPLVRGTHQLPAFAFKDTLLGLTYKFNNLSHLEVR